MEFSSDKPLMKKLGIAFFAIGLMCHPFREILSKKTIGILFPHGKVKG